MHPEPEGSLRSRLRAVDCAREAVTVLTRRPLRTMLTALGTVLGIGAFVATTGMAETARNQVSSRFDALCATEVRVQASVSGTPDPFPLDPDQQLERLNGVNHAGLIFTVPDHATYDVRNTATPSPSPSGIPITAATPGAIRAARPTLLTGTLYNRFHQERHERVALVGRDAAQRLGITRLDNQPVIYIQDNAYLVIGIVDKVARNPDFLTSVTIPTSTAATDFRDATDATDAQILIDIAPGAGALISHQAPIALRPDAPDIIQALAPPDPRTLRQQIEGDVTALLYALSALALFIGTVSISNAQLLNVTERRTEFGLRRALGARPRHLTAQITLEAALTGAAASAVGIVIGLAAIIIASATQHWAPTISPQPLLLAPPIGLATSTLAGILPARRAATTQPAVTLRS